MSHTTDTGDFFWVLDSLDIRVENTDADIGDICDITTIELIVEYEE